MANILNFPAKPEVFRKNQGLCALMGKISEQKPFKLFKFLLSYRDMREQHPDRQTEIHTDRQIDEAMVFDFKCRVFQSTKKYL